jgi:hypothetical protein
MTQKAAKLSKTHERAKKGLEEQEKLKINTPLEINSH